MNTINCWLIALHCSILMVSLTTTSVCARDLFVDGKSPLASDANTGSAKEPWKTVAHAAKAAVAGDTVHVKDGVYREFVEVGNSGEGPDKMITFRADGSKVYIKGSDEVTGWVLSKGSIWKKEGWQINSQQVFVDDKYLEQIGGNPLFSPDRLRAKGSGVADMIPGSFYYNDKEKALYVWLKDNGDPNRHFVEASTRILILRLKWKNFIKIAGFNFLHSNNTAEIKSGWPAVAINGNGCIVENNDVSWCDFTGLGGNCRKCTIKNNKCNHNGALGIGFSGSNVLLESNETNYNNYRNFDVGWHAGGMKNTILTDSIITKHTAVANNGQGIWCDIDCQNININASIVNQNTETGIFYEISEHGIIQNNIVTENGQTGIYISASSACSVLNNLTYANFRGIVLHGVPRKSSGKNYHLRDNVVQNNIVIKNSDADLVVAPPSSDSTGNTTDYNLYFSSKGKSKFKLGYERTFQGISAWSSKTGYDAHSIEAPPKFIDESLSNFHPTAGSPVIGKGLPNRVVDVDFDQRSRSQNINDIGPFRFK